MAFREHVCYLFSSNSLDFSFWSCWFHFLFLGHGSLLLLLNMCWTLFSSQLHTFFYTGSGRLFDNEPRDTAVAAAAAPMAPILKKTENSHLLFNEWMNRALFMTADQGKPSSAVTKMAISCEEIPHHKKPLRFTCIHSRDVIFCHEQDTYM